jgi:hypothetical protein
MKSNIIKGLMTLGVLSVLLLNGSVLFTAYADDNDSNDKNYKNNPNEPPGGGALECHSGGCKALECSLTLSNSGGINVGGSGGNVTITGTVTCKTFVGSGAYCCCYQNGSKLFGPTVVDKKCGC